MNRCLFFLACFLSFASSVSADPSLGLWIESEGTNQPFLSDSSFSSLKSFVEEGDYSDLYCQVYRNGRSWFPSFETFRL